MIKKKKQSVSRTAIRWSKKNNPPMMDPPESDLLIKYVKKCKIHFVEIGTYKGGSTSLISTYLPLGIRMTSIDIFKQAPRGSMSPKEKSTYKEAKKTIKDQGNISKVDIIQGKSWEIARKWNKKIDVLFIDGDHRYKVVKKDFFNWEPHVIKNGFILMHDVNFEGVKKAYREILRNPRLILKEKIGNLAVIKKLS